MEYMDARAHLRATVSNLKYHIDELERLLSVMDVAREKETSTCNEWVGKK